MPAFVVPRRARTWSSAAVLAVIAFAAAGCSNSGRFEVNDPFASTPPSEVTGSIKPQPAPSGRISSQPLPSPSKPQTVAASGVSQGAGGLGSYRPAAQSSDITGSVAAPAGHWTWEGGTPVVVGADESVEIIGRKYGVPASAIMQANGINSPAEIRPGQRIVIPRYVSSAVAPKPYQPAPIAPQHVAAPAVAPAHVAPAAPAGEYVHIVAPGESLMALSRKYHVPLTTLAKANKIEAYTKISIGDRITIPGKRAEAVKQPEPVKQASAIPSAPPIETSNKVATVPAKETVRVATPEPATVETPAKAAEPTGAMPSFRWPVHGRIISPFGKAVNGAQNDGINLAVPEGTPIKAAEDGVVAYAGNELKGYGNLVLIRHSNGYVSAYANARELTVKRGDVVKRGQVIAQSGQTGNVSSPQLHFEIRKGATPVDPTKYLAANNG